MTEAKEPTREEQEEFWGKCGFTKREYDTTGLIMHITEWRYPNGKCHKNLPPIDLNNLFRYAVPKLQSYTLTKSINGGHLAAVYVGGKWSGIQRNDAPALALFWAIWEVLK